MEEQENKNLEMLEKQNARDAQNAMCNLLLSENRYEITDFELFMMKLPKIAARFASLEKLPEDRRSEEAVAALDGWKKTVAQIADMLGLVVPAPETPEKKEADPAAGDAEDGQKADAAEAENGKEDGKMAVYLTDAEQKRLMALLKQDPAVSAANGTPEHKAFPTDLDSAAMKDNQ